MESKCKVEDLHCFKEVAKVIGRNKARIELFKVLECEDSAEDFENLGLVGSFYWDESPQGTDFWCDIFRGTNPYKKGE